MLISPAFLIKEGNSDNVTQMSLEDILTKLASGKWADPVWVALHEVCAQEAEHFMPGLGRGWRESPGKVRTF